LRVLLTSFVVKMLAARLASAVVHRAAGVRTMATGTVKWFQPSKGFGFITPDDGTNPDGEFIVCPSRVEAASGFSRGHTSL
jgi:'Cold-shock' DNA-binding domain